MKGMKTNKQASFLASALLITIILIVIVYGVMIARFPVESCLVTDGILASVCDILQDAAWDGIMDVMSEECSAALIAILVFYSVGLVIGAWMMSGTIPHFIYFGLESINPQHRYV